MNEEEIIMGLFKFLKSQALSVIEWEDSTKDTIVYRFELKEREVIMNSSTLVVRPSQVALFVHKGQICDVFAPGTYKLSTENIPLLTKLLSLPTAFEITNQTEVYFVNTKQMTGLKWGTANPIMMRDADFGNVRLRAFGVYSFKVDNAKRFMEEVFGTNPIYKADDVIEHVKPYVIQCFSDAVAESKISALDLAASYREFSETILTTGQDEFEKLGLKLCSIIIENISLPEEVEKALDERTKLGVFSDKMGTYTQMAAADAMRDAAKNTSGGNLAGLGVGLGAGTGIGKLFADSLAGAQDTPRETKKEEPKEEGGRVCVKCGASLKANAKFCSECGEKQPEDTTKFCTNCGSKVKANAKFCPECGEKF